MNFDELISKRWKEAEERPDDRRCWFELAERMALQILTLENDGKPVPMELRIKADEAYQIYQNMGGEV